MEPPNSGLLKLNVNAYVQVGNSYIRTGVVISNSYDAIIMAMTKKMWRAFNVFVAECITLREGLHACIHTYIHTFIHTYIFFNFHADINM